MGKKHAFDKAIFKGILTATQEKHDRTEKHYDGVICYL